ncbi:MAG: hypothetical protein ACI4EI_10545 [Muricoprocola sp.]
MKRKISRRRVAAVLLVWTLSAGCLFSKTYADESETESPVLQMQTETEPGTEEMTEAGTEQQTEILTEAQTEAQTESWQETEVQTDSETESETDHETEKDTEKSHTETEEQEGAEYQEQESENLAAVECTCGAEDLSVIEHEFSCPVYIQKREELCTCGSDAEDGEEHEEDCLFFQYVQECLAEKIKNETMLLGYSIPGRKLPYTGSGYTAVSAESELSAEYKPLSYTSESSSEDIGIASSELLRGEHHALSGGVYWYPKSTDLKGTFGRRYNKVLYDSGQWYDLKCVVTDWTDYEIYYNGAFRVTPYMCFAKDAISFWFDKLGQFTVRCTLVKSGTEEVASKKFRVIIKDIDGYQGIGFKVGSNTSVDAKKVYDDCQIYYSSNYYKNGLRCEDYLVAKGSAEDDPWSSVIYELTGSEFYLTMGEDNAVWFYYGVENARHDQIASASSKGEDIYTTSDIISIYSSVVNPQSIGTLEKSASEDGINWNQSFSISDIDTEFYYKLRHFVPEEEGVNYYSKYVLMDELPEGIDFAGEALVKCVESGEDVTEEFSISSQEDTIVATAGTSLLQNEEFYGHYYDLILKVKLDETEISPVEKENGEFIYEVTNKGKAIIRHQVDSQDSETESNVVTVTATGRQTETALELTKELDAADIVWSHGNPVFLFKISGEDVSGVTHTYYEAVEFEREDADSGSLVSKTVSLIVPAGTYTVTEEKTARYYLEEIKDITGGTAEGDSVVFHLEGPLPGNETAKATFHNGKKTDEGLSDASFVENVFK